MSSGEQVGAVEQHPGTKGDAVWVVPRTEHVPARSRISFGDLLEPDQQIQLAAQAIESFGSPEQAEARKTAVHTARKLLRLDDDSVS